MFGNFQHVHGFWRRHLRLVNRCKHGINNGIHCRHLHGNGNECIGLYRHGEPNIDGQREPHGQHLGYEHDLFRGFQHVHGFRRRHLRLVYRCEHCIYHGLNSRHLHGNGNERLGLYSHG